tara:strand:- start:1321 stop:1785 length:465 start_codon:yes stop_codon:yes gene_type:complete
MDKLEILSKSDLDTKLLGKLISNYLKVGDIVFLNGDLGAGKTKLVEGISEGLESPQTTKSPTFVLIHEYDSRIKIYHCDLYRIKNELEVIDLNIEEKLENGIVIIEWPNIAKNILPSPSIEMFLSHSDNDNHRKIIINNYKNMRIDKINKEFSK